MAITFKVLESTIENCRIFSESVNAGWTTRYLFTGSIPMRPIDIEKQWALERKRGDLLWGIFSDKLVGTMGLHSHRDIYRSWELRIIIFDPEYVSRGVGPKAVKYLVDYGFNRLNAHRIWLGVNAMNERAIKCYLKCGFKVEGKLRDEIFCFGEYHDAIRMGILEDEWRETQRHVSSEQGESDSRG